MFVLCYKTVICFTRDYCFIFRHISFTSTGRFALVIIAISKGITYSSICCWGVATKCYNYTYYLRLSFIPMNAPSILIPSCVFI